MDKTFKQKLEILPIKNIQHPVGNTKYYAAVHVKTLIAQADEEIADLKSQLQQQALPVVPECVAGVIEKDKQANVSISDVFEAIFSYENHYLTEAGLWTKNNPEKYIIARNIGYTVEKPQLFYLKNKLTTSYLALDTNTGYYEHWGEEIIPKLLNKQGYKLSFTKQEIDSMQTGSYEKIEVVE